MRQITKILASLTLVLFFSGAAFAGIFEPGQNFFQFTNYENLLDLDENGEVSAGDLFYGVAKLTYIQYPDASDGAFNGPTYLLSSFYLEVASFDNIGDNLFVNFKTPNSIAEPLENHFTQQDLDSGIVMKWFETGSNWDLSSVDNALSSVENGNLWMALSLTEGFWYGQLTEPNESTLDQTVESNYGLNLVGGFESPLVPTTQTDYNGLTYDVGFWGQASIYPNTDTFSTNWFFKSTDPAYVIATPEPGTLLLLGAGLLGLGAVARRRKN